MRGEAAWRLIWRLAEADVKRLTDAERGVYRMLLKHPSCCVRAPSQALVSRSFLLCRRSRPTTHYR